MNFSIVLPGACNAKCNFCFWSRSRVESPMYVQHLAWYLDNMNLTEVSITGGEPTMSPSLTEVLGVLNNRGLKVVLTSNGYRLFDVLPSMRGIVDHINVSRHAVEDNINNCIFGTDIVPGRDDLRNICGLANQQGIDVTLNRVVDEHWDDEVGFMNYLELARQVGASAITIRKDYSGNSLESVPLEGRLGVLGRQSGCPVCITTTYFIKGMPVHFKRSLEETDSQGVHEYVYHPDGKLTSDWAGKNYVEVPVIMPMKRIVVSPGGSCRQISSSHC